MSFASKYSRSSPFSEVSIKDLTWTSLAELAKVEGTGTVYQLRALLINRKGKFGNQPVLVTNTHCINGPKHLLKDVSDMLADPEAIAAIREGKAGFVIREYEASDYGKLCYSVDWVDL